MNTLDQDYISVARAILLNGIKRKIEQALVLNLYLVIL